MKKSGKIKKTERLEIAILRNKGYGVRAIARVLDRSPSTISEEIKRNSVGGVYDPQKAQVRVYLRKSRSKKDWKKIEKTPALKAYIIGKLKLHWNPLEISQRMKLEQQSFYASKTAIYEWLRSNRGQYYCKYLYSRRYRVKKRTPKATEVTIPNRVGITQRPLGATNRSRFGHWETDTIVSSRRGTGALSVSVDRKSRYVLIDKLATMRPSEHIAVLRQRFSNLKTVSVTFDNGIENRDHQQLSVPTFFCDTYSSWQKGSVENANKMIRRYIPKGSDISKVSLDYIQWIQDTINNKPRAVLGFKSSYDIMRRNNLLGGVRIGG